ncbi:hypothetical protein GCM10007973_01780 [Polymorphobacter multimanifer]|uniref:PEP-CTERM sorting domain-containing protein n=1 Tax=Polymorphobacter multimanifer TaxID=1070431 RepID=A0A841L938_9SPHN|nr:PEPxxWA-CTERM sorting domain-containing protein [Polymorphobacter multimanifer]MBB6227483.1 hypothetical protein [Polymorphobacter multimanifer]GGI68378.1 hypothetical protein GCM10007973_01780 [Polymorphobacter multimanifer]
MRNVYFFAAAIIVAAPLSAATITPVSVVASNTFPFFGEYRDVNLINGSGLVGGLHSPEYTDMWMTDLGVNQATLVFDLGATYTLKGATFWNYNFVNPAQFQSTILRGVKDFQLFTSTDGVAFSEAYSGTLTLGTGEPLAGQAAAFTGDARYVRFDILNNYGQGTYAEASWNAGLSEVRFNGIVPEPMTWGMLIAGFGLTGAAMRRRAAVAA